MKKKTKKIILISFIALAAILIALFFIIRPRFVTYSSSGNIISSIASLSFVSSANQTESQAPAYYYTRYTGCNTPLTQSQLGVVGHGVYFTSQSDCLNYNNAVGYMEIYPW